MFNEILLQNCEQKEQQIDLYEQNKEDIKDSTNLKTNSILNTKKENSDECLKLIKNVNDLFYDNKNLIGDNELNKLWDLQAKVDSFIEEYIETGDIQLIKKANKLIEEYVKN